jgi:DASS family divalent anion:Na+ symporter
MTPANALKGYSDPLVWLVLCAFFISRGVMKTGLGERIAYHFIRAIGQRSIGLVYALVGTDTLLATIIPSNSARAGGVIFPIARSLAQAYDSHPGPTARRLGAYLMVAVYHCDVIACAMFLTGQASNVLIARFAKEVSGVELTFTSWAAAMIVPGPDRAGARPHHPLPALSPRDHAHPRRGIVRRGARWRRWGRRPAGSG